MNGLLERPSTAMPSIEDAELAATASRALARAAKESLNSIEYADLKIGYELEQRHTTRLSGTADSAEARRAIVEKRPPTFQEHAFEGRA